MRVLALFAAIALLAAPAFAPPAYADGIERPRPRVTRRAPPPRPAPPVEAPPARVEQRVESNIVTLPESFFAGGGGVGADIGGAYGVYSSSTVIIRGGSASASASAFASSRASAGARGGGFRGGGGGCACH